MAFNLFQFLGLEKKRPDIPKFKGPKPPASLKEIPETQEFLKTIRERIAGRGVGFREAELRAATSPFAAERRAGLREQTIPTIQAAASARGLGRSTIPVSRIGLESSAAERDIGAGIGALRLANEEQRRREINASLAALGQFGPAEAGQAGTRAAFEANLFTQGRALQAQQEAQQAAGGQALFQNLLGLGTLGVNVGTLVGKLTGAIKPAPLFDLGGLSPTGVTPTTGPVVNINKTIEKLGKLSDEEKAFIGLK